MGTAAIKPVKASNAPTIGAFEREARRGGGGAMLGDSLK
eukprot:CAMPEP_0183334286 /NCGR_PEP_ID=MMETSP0164_2-20130417/2938_1 /TAXON_ID=221442 /ORGANISM="Coccolithus pelagicus ssp braarudi, Strain PLY182g" /LENGTH=38 /DNA_ID= /DNA_START= /DNA_END= /DNA_ORIENTATION=